MQNQNTENNYIGKTHIAPAVFRQLALKAVNECYGVAGIARRNDILNLGKVASKRNQLAGIDVLYTKDGVKIDIYVIIEYGTNVSVVAKNLSDQVRFEIKHFCNAKVDSIQIHVKGVRTKR